MAGKSNKGEIIVNVTVTTMRALLDVAGVTNSQIQELLGFRCLSYVSEKITAGTWYFDQVEQIAELLATNSRLVDITTEEIVEMLSSKNVRLR